MKIRKITIAAVATIALSAGATTTVTWSTLGNSVIDNNDVYIQRFSIHSDTAIDGIAFNQFARRMSVMNEADTLSEIVPGYYRLTSARLTPGATIEIDIVTRGNLSNICYAPDGVHAIINNVATPATFVRKNITERREQWVTPAGKDIMPYGDSIYARHARLTPAEPGFYDIIPSLKRVDLLPEGAQVIKTISYIESPSCQTANGWRAHISDGNIVVEATAENMPIARLRMATLGIKIGDTVPAADIEDYPDFDYRGIMIDVARNFQSVEQMKRIIDMMARYGLNVLHFHIADDEAWRIEIGELPELTMVGSRRGYTTDEHEYMAQLFTGNGDPDSHEGTSNGYYTRAEFVSIVSYAHERGICIIPEIESPGHARAAIKAMERRYRLTGDDTYRLIDPQDTSIYTSAQSFHDNVMNPVLPGPARLMTVVARELQDMYREAGTELVALHIGGDEVAMGAWRGSPIARQYMQEHGITDERLLHLKFVTEVVDSLSALGIKVSGWQEIAVGHDYTYNNKLRPAIYSVNCWSTLGRQGSVPAQCAEAGYPTVLSNVDHFYMDLCYTPHPYERGLSWGGYVDQYDALHGYPEELCRVDSAAYANVIGISGHLFAETIRSGEMLESFLLPKMLGLAERAWNSAPTYSDAAFNSVVVKREMPYWQSQGYNYHIEQPGIAVIDNKITMNSQSGCDIHYTTDGSEPTADSPIYTCPIDASGISHVRAIAVDHGRHSVTSILYIK